MISYKTNILNLDFFKFFNLIAKKTKVFLTFYILFCTIFSSLYSVENLYAAESSSISISSDALELDRVREVSKDPSQACMANKLNPDVTSISSIGIFGEKDSDTNWELADPSCATLLSGLYVALKAAEIATQFSCNDFRNSVNPIKLSSMILPISYYTIQNQASAGVACAGAMADCGRTIMGPSRCPMAGPCCGSLATYVATSTSMLAALGIIYGVAQGAYEKGRICGHNWYTWGYINDRGEEVDYGYAENKRIKKGSFKGSYKLCLDHLFSGQDRYKGGTRNLAENCGKFISNYQEAVIKNISNKRFREYVYQGIEFEDNGNNVCKNPTSWDAEKRNRILGYATNNQRYYMRGGGELSNYACHRFLMDNPSDKAAQDSYNCCVNKSQNNICIENSPLIADNYDYEMCSNNSICNVRGVYFKTYTSENDYNFICARTYSLCPFNHLLGGGSEIKKLENDSEEIVNYCQYMSHCTKIPDKPYVRRVEIGNIYVSDACVNLKGDSQNSYSYNADSLNFSIRNFTAPIAQCFKETMENLLLNKAGKTLCANLTEFPNRKGECVSGNYIYKKGENVDHIKTSFISRFNGAIHNIIKLALVLSVTFFGLMLLLGGIKLEKKEIFVYIAKLAFVSYFALGSGVKDHIVGFVLNTAVEIGDIVYLDDRKIDAKLDGCQFPKFNYQDINSTSNISYPPQKGYLKMWDTFDCKIAKALGFSEELSVPTLFMMLGAALLTGALGIYFFIFTLLFAFFVIAVSIRALNIFVVAMLTLAFLTFISPIAITCWLFDKTKGVFENWFKNILGISLQPIILFGFLGILFSIYDSFLIGDATFVGDGRFAERQIICGGNSDENSIYCFFKNINILNISKVFTKITGIPIVFIGNLNVGIIMTMFKAVVALFILSAILEKIISFSGGLVRGVAHLPSSTPGFSKITSTAFGAARGVQKRAAGAARKLGGAIGNATYNKARNFANRNGPERPKPGNVGGGDNVSPGTRNDSEKNINSSADNSRTDQSDRSNQ